MSSGTERPVNKEPSWWKNRSTLERCLTVLSVGGLLLCIALIVGVCLVAGKIRSCDGSPTDPSYNKDRFRSEKALQSMVGDQICTSLECIHTASTILRNMNQDVDPCDDFYDFACGGFSNATVIPDDRTGVDTYSKIYDYLQLRLKTIVEKNIQPNESRPFKLAKTLYQNCMNKSLIERQGLEPLQEILKKLGGWPVLLNNWDDSDFDWTEAVYKNRKLGYPTSQFINFLVFRDQKNSSTRIIHLDEATLGLHRKYLIKGLDDELVIAYYNFITEVAVTLGADRDRATSELLESLNFEISLAKICLPNEKRRNITRLYNLMSVEELSRAYPSIPWLEYINTQLAPNQRIESNEVVNVYAPKYIEELEKLLGRTPKRVQANYAMWRVVKDSIYALSDNVRKWEKEFTSKLTGKTERKPRWEECLDTVSNRMALSIGALYVRNYFSEEAKNKVIDMVSNIRKEFKKIIQKVDWMDEETRVAALEKANVMGSSIGYPDELLDDKKLEEFYASLEITDGKYLFNMLEYNLFSKNRHYGTFRKPVNRTAWISYGDAAVVNAFYSQFDNSIQLPAGILQGELFNKDRPQYVNYGTIGSTIGHEITHGFDDTGSQYDKEGNLVEWWKKETKNQFLQKAQCIIHQYGNYTQKQVQMNLNGINTEGENIADNGGIKVAYLAYNEWARENGREPRLPGLNYTSQQMFWIGVANEACGTYRPETLKLRITTDPHSPKEFRVIGPLSNMPEFARDFNCPVGSRMNPAKKCVVW